MEVHTLFEGSYSVDATKKFLPFVDGVDKAKDRPGSLFIHVQPFLVEVGDYLALFDTGLGFSNADGELVIHEQIRKAGFNPEDVTHVLMSHLHYDHAGGMVHLRDDKMDVSFPQADYVIQRGEWETAFTNTTSSYKTDIFEFLQRNAHIEFVEGSGEFLHGINYELTGAHTPYHQAFLLSDEGGKVFFGGDVLPEPEELVKNFIAKYDYDGRKAMELRKGFAVRAVQEDWNCLFYHAKSKATGHVRQVDNSYKIV